MVILYHLYIQIELVLRIQFYKRLYPVKVIDHTVHLWYSMKGHELIFSFAKILHSISVVFVFITDYYQMIWVN